MTPRLQKQIHQLVDRARSGDQNAMGMIDETRLNAQGGLKRAQDSMREVFAYIQIKPARSPMGEETKEALSYLKNPNLDPQSILHILCFLPHTGDVRALEAACVILAGGSPMSADRIAALDSQVIDEYKPAFHFGIDQATMNVGGGLSPYAEGGPSQNPDPVTLGYLCSGACIGLTRRIQQIRGGAPFSMLSPLIGWELDCI